MKKRIAIIAVVGTLLQGCIPHTLLYSRLEAPDSKYFKSRCFGGAGATSVIYYPFHGIYISLNITGTLRLGLHVPAGEVAQLTDNAIKIEGRSGDETFVGFSGKLIAARQGSIGAVYPKELRALPDPYSSPDNFGPLMGGSKNGEHVWYFFTAMENGKPNRFSRLPTGLIRGTVELPSISVNGVNYGPQIIPFKQDTYFELGPINC